MKYSLRDASQKTVTGGDPEGENVEDDGSVGRRSQPRRQASMGARAKYRDQLFVPNSSKLKADIEEGTPSKATALRSLETESRTPRTVVADSFHKLSIATPLGCAQVESGGVSTRRKLSFVASPAPVTPQKKASKRSGGIHNGGFEPSDDEQEDGPSPSKKISPSSDDRSSLRVKSEDKKSDSDERDQSAPSRSEGRPVRACRALNLNTDGGEAITPAKTPSKSRSRGRRSEKRSQSKESDFENAPSSAKKVSPLKILKHPLRLANKQEKKRETLEDVMGRLHTSVVPERLPCRETEFKAVCEFIRNSVRDNGISQSIYISGVPGTGKTATVMQAVRFMESSEKFSSVFVNGMEVSDPKQIFLEIHTQLCHPQRKVSANNARKLLNEMFRSRDRSRLPVVLIIDELDPLCTKRQDIVYDIFNWTSNAESRVSVLAIANTLDLPERLLSGRVASRLGLNRILFEPYDHSQIVSIIQDRLRGCDAVEKDAVELASRKVAALSGDLRKALDILRRATQNAISANEEVLTMKHVQLAVQQATNTVRVEFVRSLSRHSFLFLRAALSEHQNTGLEDLTFSEIVRQYRLQCHMCNTDPLTVGQLYRNAMDLCNSCLLLAGPGSSDFNRRFRLGMSAQELQFAIKQVKEDIL